MKSLKEYNLGFWIGMLCLTVFIYIVVEQKKEISETNNEITRKGNLTVGKVYDFKQSKRHRTYSYYYFIDNVKYRGTCDSDFGFGENAIGHFYQVKCLKNDPSNSILFLEYEVEDVNEILNSGFTIVKSSYFDASKNER